jgi:hypothetical protein
MFGSVSLEDTDEEMERAIQASLEEIETGNELEVGAFDGKVEQRRKLLNFHAKKNESDWRKLRKGNWKKQKESH